MKYIVLLGDGMADYPLTELNGKTPLQAAKKPAMDYMARKGVTGMVKTIPEGVVPKGGTPGSDIANLSVMGYNPGLFYTGRSPLEAVSMGIALADTDVAVRCNLVTLSEEMPYASKTMLDYSADEISTAEAAVLIAEIQRKLGDERVRFYGGISYRHCMVWANGACGLALTPPHDIAERCIAAYLPENDMFRSLMMDSYECLRDHPVNAARVARGLRPANSIWLWGEGTKLTIPSFASKYDKTGVVISAVDLLKGIGISAGLTSIDVPGATGNINTDFTAKKDAAIRALASGKDFVYLHVEAPDECGHRHEIENKVRAIELIDQKIAGPLLEALKPFGPFRILLLPDHPTPLALRTHTSEPVPFVLYDSENETDSGVAGYDEAQAAATGVYVAEGHTMMDRLMQPNFCIDPS